MVEELYSMVEELYSMVEELHPMVEELSINSIIVQHPNPDLEKSKSEQ